jgi:hypothetical protein
MKSRSLLLVALAVMLCNLACVRTACGQVTATLGSNVDAYFGGLSDGYQASNPAGLNPWTPVGLNPPAYYSTVYQLPNIPGPPPGNVAPSNVTTFAPIPSSSSFNDGFNDTATSTILGVVAGPSYTADAAMVNLTSGGMTLMESTGLYDYEQLNYDIDFSVSNSVNIFGTSGTIGGIVTRTYSVSGLVGTGPGAFVAFGGEMNFWDATTNTSLGSPLTFNYFNNVGGAFSGTVSGSAFVAAVNSPDVLRITGDFFVIGDPSSINVESVPEPSTFVLGALACLCSAAVALKGRNVAAKSS